MTNKNNTSVGEGSAEKAPPSFSVDQLLEAKCFANRKDALKAALQPEKRYTVAEAVQAINEYLERKV